MEQTNALYQRHKHLSPRAYELVMNWLNEHYGGLLKSSNYISNEIARNLDNGCYDDGAEATQIQISTGYLGEETECNTYALEDLIFYFLAQHVGVDPNMNLANIIRDLKKQAQSFLNQLEEYKVNWDDREDVEFLQKELVSNHGWTERTDLEDLVYKHMEQWHPNPNPIRKADLSCIKRVEKELAGKTMSSFIDTYYEGSLTEFKEKLTHQGFNLKDFTISGDDSGDYIDMAFSSILSLQEFLHENSLYDQEKYWQELVADSKVLQEVIRLEQFYFIV